MEVISGILGTLIIAIIYWMLRLYKDGVNKSELQAVKEVVHKRIDNIDKEIIVFNISLNGLEKDVVNNKILHDNTMNEIKGYINELKADTKEIKSILINKK